MELTPHHAERETAGAEGRFRRSPDEACRSPDLRSAHGDALGQAARDLRASRAGQLLLIARTRALVSQRELAEIAEVSHSTVARIEKGRVQPSIVTLDKILNAAWFQLSFGLQVMKPMSKEEAEMAPRYVKRMLAEELDARFWRAMMR